MRSLICCGWAGVLGVWFLLAGCTNYEQDKKNWPDTWDKGTIHISADESFKPVIDEQVQVYESNTPGAKIIIHYKPEAECLKDFLVDSIRMIIATRGFTQSEENLIIDSLKTEPRKLTVARDAIAVMSIPCHRIRFLRWRN
ncbi:MAG: substrate-binding domain-containing protein [Bacteroidota bacterium]